MTHTPHQELATASEVGVIDDLPFKLSTDPRFFYPSHSAQAAYDSLLTGVRERQRVMLLVGEPGTGKTTLLLKLKEALEATHCRVVFPRRPVLSYDELIQASCEAAGIARAPMDHMDKVQALTNILVERASDGATVIFIDDAQALSDEFLANLCRLTKIEKGDAPRLQVILAGQSDLVTRLSASDLPFAQESATACRHLGRLDTREVSEYIAYRLARVGRKAQPFAPKSIRHIAEFSHGIPQVINQVCGMSLVATELEDAAAVSAEIVDATIQALVGTPSQMMASVAPPEAITPVFTREAGRSLVEQAAEVEAFDRGEEKEDQPSKGFTDGAAEKQFVTEGGIGPEAGSDHPSLDADFQSLAIDWPSIEADLTVEDGAQEEPDPSFPAGFDPNEGRPEEHLFTDLPRRGRPATIAAILLIGLVVGGAAMVLLEVTGGGGSAEQIAVTRPSSAASGMKQAAEDEIPHDGDAAVSIVESPTLSSEASLAFDPEAEAEIPEVALEAEAEIPEVAQNAQIDLPAPGGAEAQSVPESVQTASLDRKEVEPASDEGSKLANMPEQDNGLGEVETALAGSAEVPQPAELSSAQPWDETQTASSDDGREFFLQLASLHSADGAQRERERLATLHGDLLNEFELSIQKVDVGGLTYYRVRSAPFTGGDKAYETCAQLDARAQGCLVRQAGNGIEDTSPTVNDTGTIVAKPVGASGSASQSSVLAPPGGLAVREFVLSHDVEEREPVGLTETFSTTDRVGYAYARLRNLGPPKHVAFVWRHQDAVISRFETTVGTSARWRTWSNAELRPGEWVVQLVSEDGDVLADTAFMVE